MSLMRRAESVAFSRAASAAFAGASLSPSCSVSVTASQRRFKVKIKNLEADDPFGEKMSWDHSFLTHEWRNIDIDGLKEAMERDDVKQVRFGGDGALADKAVMAKAAALSTQAGAAKAAREKHLKPEELEEARIEYREMKRKDQERRVFSKNYATYEEFAKQELSRQGYADDDDDEFDAEGDEDADETGALSGSGEALSSQTGASGDAAGEVYVDMPPAVPDSIRPDAPISAFEFMPQEADDTVKLTASQIATRRDRATADVFKGKGDLDDPIHWTTEDVIVWLDHFGPEGCMDDSMKQAFEMVGVTGDMLLNRVAVPDLFKEMRRWHVKLGKNVPYYPQVTEQMVQEAIYMCYPYGQM